VGTDKEYAFIIKCKIPGNLRFVRRFGEKGAELGADGRNISCSSGGAEKIRVSSHFSDKFSFINNVPPCASTATVGGGGACNSSVIPRWLI